MDFFQIQLTGKENVQQMFMKDGNRMAVFNLLTICSFHTRWLYVIKYQHIPEGKFRCPQVETDDLLHVIPKQQNFTTAVSCLPPKKLRNGARGVFPAAEDAKCRSWMMRMIDLWYSHWIMGRSKLKTVKKKYDDVVIELYVYILYYTRYLQKRVHPLLSDMMYCNTVASCMPGMRKVWLIFRSARLSTLTLSCAEELFPT